MTSMASFQSQQSDSGGGRWRVSPAWAWSVGGAAAFLLLAVTASALMSRAEPSAQPESAIVFTKEPITPIPSPPEADPLKLALGEELFQSRLLSHDQTLSCRSCHDVRSNGADNVQRAVGADGRPLALNTPTVFNAVLSFRLNWEGDRRTLESQAAWALNSAPGLGTRMTDVLADAVGTVA